MNSQITLSLRPEILQKAKEAAERQGISPADYLIRFLEKVLAEPLPEESITAQIERLSQSTPKTSEAEYEQRKHEHRMRKYGS